MDGWMKKKGVGKKMEGRMEGPKLSAKEMEGGWLPKASATWGAAGVFMSAGAGAGRQPVQELVAGAGAGRPAHGRAWRCLGFQVCFNVRLG